MSLAPRRPHLVKWAVGRGRRTPSRVSRGHPPLLPTWSAPGRPPPLPGPGRGPGGCCPRLGPPPSSQGGSGAGHPAAGGCGDGLPAGHTWTPSQLHRSLCPAQGHGTTGWLGASVAGAGCLALSLELLGSEGTVQSSPRWAWTCWANTPALGAGHWAAPQVPGREALALVTCRGHRFPCSLGSS